MLTTMCTISSSAIKKEERLTDMRKLKRILAMGLAAAMLITAPGFRSVSFAAEADTYENRISLLLCQL